MGYVICLENNEEIKLNWNEFEKNHEGNFPKINNEIFQSRFWKCEELKEAYIDEGITIVGKGSFEDCANLVKVVLPSTLKKIDSFAFASTGIKEVIIPNGTFLDEDAFFECSNLETVIMPRDIKMSIDAFGGCYNIKKILLTEDNEIVDELDKEFIQYLVEKRKR